SALSRFRVSGDKEVRSGVRFELPIGIDPGKSHSLKHKLLTKVNNRPRSMYASHVDRTCGAVTGASQSDQTASVFARQLNEESLFTQLISKKSVNEGRYGREL